MTSRKKIEAQRELYAKPILVGDSLAVKVLTVRNKYFGILDGCDIPGKTVVTIDPACVFGDGTHATTQMCVEALERNLGAGARVLDIGCGTGIQSLVALLLGAGQAESVDIDPKAVEAAANNAALNGLQERFTARVGSLTEGASGAYDMVIANILADPIMELVGILPEFTHVGTVAVLTGVSADRDVEVTRAICKAFTIKEKETREGWLCYVVTPGASGEELEAAAEDYEAALAEFGVSV